MVIKIGYAVMNEGEFDDLQNITFCNNLREAQKWKGQKIVPIEIRFANCTKDDGGQDGKN